MHIKLHHPEDLMRLRQRSHQERDAKQRNRYRAVLLAIEVTNLCHGDSEVALSHTSSRLAPLWACF